MGAAVETDDGSGSELAGAWLEERGQLQGAQWCRSVTEDRAQFESTSSCGGLGSRVLSYGYTVSPECAHCSGGWQRAQPHWRGWPPVRAWW